MVQRRHHHWLVALLTAGLAVFMTASAVHSSGNAGLDADDGGALTPTWCNGVGDPCDTPNEPFFCEGPGHNDYGDCCVLHDVAGCESAEIEDCVCGQDEFCCEGKWDFSCLVLSDACGAECFDADHPDPCAGHDADHPCAGPNPEAWCFGCPPDMPNCTLRYDPCAGPKPEPWCSDCGPDDPDCMPSDPCLEPSPPAYCEPFLR